MKSALNLVFLLFTFFIFSDQSLSLSYSQIKRFCAKERNEQKCIRGLREKKYILEKGNYIEIPVIPYKR